MGFFPPDIVHEYCGEKWQYKSQGIILQNGTKKKEYTGALQGKITLFKHTLEDRRNHSAPNSPGYVNQIWVDSWTAGHPVLDWKMYLLLFIQDVYKMHHHPIDVDCAEAIPVVEHLDAQRLVLYHDTLIVLEDNRWWGRTKIVKILVSMMGSGHNIFVDKHFSSWF